MLDFFETLYLGNTLVRWVVALSMIFFSLLAGRVVNKLAGGWLKRLTGRMKSDLAALLVDNAVTPLAIIVTISSVRLSLAILTLPQGLSNWLDNLQRFLLTLAMTWFIVRFYEAFHDSYLVRVLDRPDSEFDDQLLFLLRSGMRFVVIGMGLVIAINNAGYDVGTILAGLGIGGLAIALAAQHTFDNLISGVNLFLDRHIKIGDRIQVRGASGHLIDGQVLAMGFRTIKIKTRFRGRIASIPNSIVANREVINVDVDDARQMFSVFRLSPNLAVEKVEKAMELLREIATGHESTRDEAVSGLVRVTDTSYDLILVYWIIPDGLPQPWLRVRTAINLEILRRFEEQGITFTDRSHYEYQQNDPLM